MLSIILLAVIALLYTVIYWKHSVEYVKKKWRFIKLMNALPGPSAMTILKEISKLSLDPESETWYKFRRILTPAFHFNILNKYIEGFNEQSKILTEKLEKHCGTGETFDILPMLRLFGLDVIAETAMGVSLNAQSGQNAEYSISLAKLFNLMWAKTYYPWFWFAAIRWLYGYDQKVENVCNVCKSITMKIFQKKKKEWEAFKNQPSAEDVSGSGKKRLPFLELLFSVRDEYNLSDEDIKCQVDMFMSTG
ncbi:unnamed protein product [Anisakis simplex]|uniref:Cytochrome P450 4V2 (inferred by orthology to a human protein) n=1 Tax=Anisakis simplex TaxID=6269 RepID=A0A0M3K715_ANISI|nr:unnamed protein product [Anisakis simplex]